MKKYILLISLFLMACQVESKDDPQPLRNREIGYLKRRIATLENQNKFFKAERVISSNFDKLESRVTKNTTNITKNKEAIKPIQDQAYRDLKNLYLDLQNKIQNQFLLLTKIKTQKNLLEKEINEIKSGMLNLKNQKIFSKVFYRERKEAFRYIHKETRRKKLIHVYAKEHIRLISTGQRKALEVLLVSELRDIYPLLDDGELTIEQKNNIIKDIKSFYNVDID